MKKVLIIIGALYIGGAERVARDIGYYADKRFEIHYLVFGDRVGAYEAGLLEKGCKVIHTAPPSRNHAAYYRFLRRLIRREGYDVIHAHTMFNSGWAMLAAKRCGVPVRITHSHSALVVPRSPVKKLYEGLMRGLVLRCATACVACGRKAGVRLYGEKAFSKSGILLLNGINTEAFRFDPAARDRIRSALGCADGLVIGHVGHLAEVKNQSFLIRLMPELLKERPEARLLLLGDGDDRPALEGLIRSLRLEDRVIMTGNVSNVNEYLSAMDVFAFPSLYEGMPLSIVEVQANGLPCVISDRVPKDVFVTDLLTPLPLERPELWITELLRAARADSARYTELVREKGLDVSAFLTAIYRLYSDLPVKE